MYPQYNSKKSAHTAMEFIRLAGGRLDVLSLLKFMYLADRASFEQFGYPITYDRYFSLPFGPIPSQVYDNTKGVVRRDDHFWERLIVREEGNSLSVREYEDPVSLSEINLTIIRETFRVHRPYIGGQFIDHVHEICPEWEDPNGSSKPISVESILRAVGVSEESTQHILDNMTERALLEAL